MSNENVFCVVFDVFVVDERGIDTVGVGIFAVEIAALVGGEGARKEAESESTA